MKKLPREKRFWSVILPVTVCVATVVLFYASCLTASASTTTRLRVAVDTGMPPLQFTDHSGKITGMHIELLDRIAESANLDVEYIAYDRISEAVSDLQKGKADAVLGALPTDTNAAANVRFTEAISAMPVCLVSEDRTNPADENSQHFSVAFELGTISFTQASQLLVRNSVILGNQLQLYRILTGGQAEAVIMLSDCVHYLLKQDHMENRYVISRNHISTVEYAILTRTTDQTLYATLNESISRMRMDGRYEDILNRWIVNRDLERANVRFRRILTGITLAALAVLVLFGIFSIMNYRLKKLVDIKTMEIQDQMERMYEASKAQTLNRTVAGLAHEIKNPLTSIRSFASLITEQGNDPEFQSAFREYVPREVDRISGLIEMLINYARPPRAEKENMSVEALIRDCVSLAYVSAHRNVKLECDDTVKAVICANKNQLQQALTNLLINAIESAEEKLKTQADGGEQAYVRIRSDRRETGEIVLEVRDNGTGMSKTQMAQCTEPFFTTKSNGVGMGLALTSQFVKENGGHLEIESKEGEYTIVRMVFREETAA